MTPRLNGCSVYQVTYAGGRFLTYYLTSPDEVESVLLRDQVFLDELKQLGTSQAYVKFVRRNHLEVDLVDIVHNETVGVLHVEEFLLNEPYEEIGIDG